MRLLLDTHAFLWWVDDAPELSARARKTIADPANECLLSLASCWELAIKTSIGKLKLQGTVERFIPEQLAANHFGSLDIAFRHVARVAIMPFRHRDPFDRLLAAQAMEDHLPIVSADTVFEQYGVRRIW